MQAVILAGGRGTRLAPFTDYNPKPMYEINGTPFIGHLLKQVKSFGIDDVVLLLGYLADSIMDYVKAGEEFGVKVHCHVTPEEFETGARLKAARAYLNDAFLLMYCDNYCPIDYDCLLREFKTNNSDIQLTVYTNRDGYTKSNLIVDDGRVLIYDKQRETGGLQGVDIGYALVKKNVLSILPDDNVNFEAYEYPELVKRQTLFAYLTEHRYYSIGSWERIELTKKFFNAPPVVFLDRDGTLNVRPPRACYVENPNDFIWLEGAVEGVKLLKDAGYGLYLVTNQPGLARGRLDHEQLNAIHQKMRQDLRGHGTDIDGIYVCPHNWDEGCQCRKPNPGMLFTAQREHCLDMRKCYLIGDDERDIMAAKSAGCKSILVGDGYSLLDAVKGLLKGSPRLE